MFESDGCEGQGSTEWTILSVSEGIITLLGLSFNLITVITLSSNPVGFEPITKVLFQHQALVNPIVCLLGIGMIIQPCMWMSGNQTFDFLLCQVWHSQGFYWTWVLLSIWNIMYISFERFIKINYPCRHRHTPVRDVCRGFTIIYILGFLCLIPEYFQVRHDVEKRKCFADFYPCSKGFETFMNGWSVVWFLISYIIPIATFVGIYVATILSIEKGITNLQNQCRDSFAASQLYEKESNYITRTVVVVAIAFSAIAKLGYIAIFTKCHGSYQLPQK